MGDGQGRRKGGYAVAASIVAHLAVLALLLTHRWAFQMPTEQPDSPWDHIVTVELAPHAHAQASAARPTRILGRAPRRNEQPVPLAPSQPATTAPPVAAPAATSQPPAIAGPSGPGAGTALAGDANLGAALRHGVLGCANLVARTREEREACDDKLGAGAKNAPVLAEGRDPRIQAYFDAVAKAKAPDKPLTPIRATGALGPFDTANYGTTGHPPGVECHLRFGPGAKGKRLPSHWLKLGPCALVPPQGPLSVEADITPPDQDLSHPAPRSGPQRPPGTRAQTADTQTPPAPRW